jgi:hypothetical protein
MGKTLPIEQLQDSCEEHIYYPLNLVQHPLRAQLGHAYLDKLNERATTLFDESKAKLDFVILQYNDGSMIMSTQSNETMFEFLSHILSNPSRIQLPHIDGRNATTFPSNIFT